MPKSVLVTGAAGFIGSHAVEALLRRGDRVVGLDNFDGYYAAERKRANLAEARAAAPSAFTAVEGDVRDRGLLSELFAAHAFDCVVHLAALPGVRTSIGQATRYFDVNVQGTIGVLDACVARRVGHVVFASTSSVYGNASRLPFVEDDPCDRPLAPYPASKRSCELLGHSYHHLHGLGFTALRFFTVYGPRNRPDMMASLLLDGIARGTEVELYEAGNMRRDWTYVGDIVDGVLAAVDRPLGYEVLNLGRGEPVPLTDFVAVIERLCGRAAALRTAPMPASDMKETFASIDKARRMIGYAPKVSVADGAERLYRWYVRTHHG